jgi:hypothetical protein
LPSFTGAHRQFWWFLPWFSPEFLSTSRCHRKAELKSENVIGWLELENKTAKTDGEKPVG